MKRYWQTPRLHLRAVEEKDAEAFRGWGQDEEICRNVDMVRYPQSLEQVKMWLLAAAHPKNDAFRWIAEDQAQNVVGTIDTFACDSRNGTFKYGITVSREHWGQGYGKEMVIAILRYYFFELGYQKVTPHVYSYNERSIRLHEKLGFQREGQLRSMVYSNGKYYDEVHFGMHRDEFAARYAEGKQG
ncbi:MAG: N-acetyltransferase [Paenibacillaceae bacterium]|nr:N-acetyltransferase [Paenibacillaceae bacterium]